jgi:predicted  nucleic acid-binding Zn-ribbon protein
VRRVKYDPAQPRVPAGDPDGGQWTGDGNGDSGNGDEPEDEGARGKVPAKEVREVSNKIEEFSENLQESEREFSAEQLENTVEEAADQIEGIQSDLESATDQDEIDEFTEQLEIAEGDAYEAVVSYRDQLREYESKLQEQLDFARQLREGLDNALAGGKK